MVYFSCNIIFIAAREMDLILFILAKIIEAILMAGYHDSMFHERRLHLLHQKTIYSVG
jgi:hypothetical protein